MSGEVAFGLIGGLVAIFVGYGLESFLFWTTAIISGFFVLTHVCNLTQTLESKFPALTKIHLGYLVVYTGLLGVDIVVNLVLGVGPCLLFTVLLLVAFLIDGFLKYRNWKSRSAADAVAASPASVESGGFGDTGGPQKY